MFDTPGSTAKYMHQINTYRQKGPLLSFGIIFFNYVYWWLLATKPTDNQQDFFGTLKESNVFYKASVYKTSI